MWRSWEKGEVGEDGLMTEAHRKEQQRPGLLRRVWGRCRTLPQRVTALQVEKSRVNGLKWLEHSHLQSGWKLPWGEVNRGIRVWAGFRLEQLPNFVQQWDWEGFMPVASHIPVVSEQVLPGSFSSAWSVRCFPTLETLLTRVLDFWACGYPEPKACAV